MVGDAVVIADIDVRVASIASFAPDPLVGEVAVDELPLVERCEVVHIGEVVMDHALDVGVEGETDVVAVYISKFTGAIKGNVV